MPLNKHFTHQLLRWSSSAVHSRLCVNVCNCMDVSDGSYLISTYTLRQFSLHNQRFIKRRKQKLAIQESTKYWQNIEDVDC